MQDITTTDGLNEIKAISFFSTSLNTNQSFEELLWAITKNVVHQLGFVDCIIYEFDPTEEVLLQRAAYGQKNTSDMTIDNRIFYSVG